MLVCSKCKLEKPKDSFYKNSRNKSGRYSSCKNCCKKWSKENKDHLYKYKKQYKTKYQDKYKKYHQEYYQNNKDKKILAGKKYKSSDKGKATLAALSAKYRANKRNRTPKWANLELIKKIYSNCPKGYHVDHIIPLNGEIVSGLHVQNNLQYLTASENIKKSNIFKGDL